MRRTWAAVTAGVFAVVATAQPTMRVNSDLVLVPVSVMDRADRPVRGLTADRFRVFERGLEQTVAHLSVEEQPVSVAIVFDVSGSMGAKLRYSREALEAFWRVSNPEDDFSVIEVSGRPQVLASFTRDTDALQSQLMFTASAGRTALIDGIYMAAREARKGRWARRAVLVISDGRDNYSRYNVPELQTALAESGVAVYTIGLYGDMDELAAGLDGNGPAGPALLQSLAAETGGRHYRVAKDSELPDVAAAIGAELREQYVLSYAPKNHERNGRYRHVRVTVKQDSGARWKVFARPGYRAPGGA